MLQGVPYARARAVARGRGAPGGGTLLPATAARALTTPPPDLLFLVGAVLAFAGVTALLALACGAPFVLPTERVSPALGAHAALPVVLAVTGYLALRAVADRLRTDARRGGGAAFRYAAIDLSYIGLFFVVTYFHFHIKMWMPLLNPHLHDGLYFRIDDALRPVLDAAAAARAALAAVLPVPDLWYQGAQIGLFILSFWSHALGRRRWHYHNMTALLVNLMVGPLAYLIAPAVGPFIFEDGPNASATAAQRAMYGAFLDLRAGGPSWLAAHGGEHFTAPLAAMPSLHVSAACIVSYYAIRARSPLTPLMLFLAGWIVIESVVARWHYLVDLPAGVALAALAIAVANHLCGRRHAAPAAAAREAGAAKGGGRRPVPSPQ